MVSTPARVYQPSVVMDSLGQTSDYTDIPRPGNSLTTALEYKVYNRLLALFTHLAKLEGSGFAMPPKISYELYENNVKVIFSGVERVPLAVFKEIEFQNAEFSNPRIAGNPLHCAPFTSVVLKTDYRDADQEDRHRVLIVNMARLEDTGGEVRPAIRESLTNTYLKRQREMNSLQVLKTLDERQTDTVLAHMQRLFPKRLLTESSSSSRGKEGRDNDDYDDDRRDKGRKRGRPSSDDDDEDDFGDRGRSKKKVRRDDDYSDGDGNGNGDNQSWEQGMFAPDVQEIFLNIISTCVSELTGIQVRRTKVSAAEIEVVITTPSKSLGWKVPLVIESLRKAHDILFDIDFVAEFVRGPVETLVGGTTNQFGLRMVVQVAARVDHSSSSSGVTGKRPMRPIRKIEIKAKDAPVVTPSPFRHGSRAALLPQGSSSAGGNRGIAREIFSPPRARGDDDDE